MASLVDNKRSAASPKVPATSILETILARDTMIVGGCLTVLCFLSWVYVATGAGTGMDAASMTTWHFPPPVSTSAMHAQWNVGYWAIMFAMWFVMMIAMMVPAAAPMILLHARVTRHAQDRGEYQPGSVPTTSFIAGYLLAWGFFSLLATGLQWALERAGLVDGMMMWSTAPTLSAGLLIAAGLYQLTPLKTACLRHCRAPVQYIAQSWQPGSRGAFRMGLIHGSFCLGCCWGLMLLLFAGGLMNLVWIAGLTIVVLFEKLVPRGDKFALAMGLLLVAAGVYLLIA